MQVGYNLKTLLLISLVKYRMIKHFKAHSAVVLGPKHNVTVATKMAIKIIISITDALTIHIRCQTLQKRESRAGWRYGAR